ncbi:2Fe-2S iron-sulfur cluster binding domain-containing protein [candidate division KSB1 bacterium]|nr:2Fe-2S iron-sulfur cluster binding domain-containing protein [candidate division KSB1 bacterium]NIR70382.1 2Fe-2S iron-sulfur cluster binding domain-containing protein [candidate division KSB1 bacterium]NIS23061.1 2Fe-2S iron-sulfur cluster binding domain-containing protein [candidate division KSB1 bacterium]NIT71435.1 2Fe-2S iron-sulfur cluster binding domain-containing protein [candidate division KSB1 bacterium]NIU25109.1 2Fe-2S iron-sulfur cluster binding domain-containing protein [candid
MKLTLTINNKKKSFDVPPNRTLMDLLRSQGFWSVRYGCETGDCGNCAVSVDKRAVYSCRMLAAQAEGKSIETFERIGNKKEFQPLRQIFLEFGDIECDYCIPALVLATRALMETRPDPTEDEITDALSGISCRCSRQAYPVDEIRNVIRKMQGDW